MSGIKEENSPQKTDEREASFRSAHLDEQPPIELQSKDGVEIKKSEPLPLIMGSSIAVGTPVPQPGAVPNPQPVQNPQSAQAQNQGLWNSLCPLLSLKYI